MQISITVEGQEGLTWPRWKRLAEAAERLGYAGLYRSDHFPDTRSSLELIVSLAYLADNTSRLHFGSLVAPLSFRDPAMLARQAAALDDLSGGRMVLGLGAGWEVSEHQAWGYQLGDAAMRSARFEEGLEVITQLLASDEPVSYAGKHFQLREVRLLPRPQRPRGPDILIGGNGRTRTLPLAARYADVWNVFHQLPDAFGSHSQALDQLLLQEGREPGDVRRTIMLMVLCGENEAELKRRAGYAYRMWAPDLADQPFARLLESLDTMFSPLLTSVRATFCPIVGSPERVAEQIDDYAEAGVEELIIQWWDVDDIEGLEAYSSQILARVN